MDHIDLTDTERQIFDRLLHVLRHFNLQTQLRVAGGWVRDKLLREESNDIDIALDNMSGTKFCKKVEQYLSSIGEEVKLHRIPRNPDRSKHLKTANIRLFGVQIDFVNLRAEDYCENSRIPTMRFGTAEEDAYRRDLTINSLFYNINTSSVEDFTQRGIADLVSGKIVTPIHPKQTFLDDPLRVFRAIRFGARFGFLLDEELKVAAVDEDVKTAIANKISRERIDCEIDLMISGNDPVKAMTYIFELQLFWTVFSLPPVVEPSIPEGSERLCVTFMDSAWRVFQLIGGSSSFTNKQRRMYLYAALLLPLRNTVYKDKKGEKIPAANHIFRNSCKLNSKDLVRLHLAAQQFVSLIPSIISVENLQILEVDGETEPNDNVQLTPKLRIDFGLLLREIKELWRASLLLALLLYSEDIASSTNKDMELNEHERRALLFNQVEKAILEMGLEEVWKLEPLLNGNKIMDILQIESGPIVKEWKQELLKWQLAHPSGSAEECIDYMKSKRARIK